MKEIVLIKNIMEQLFTYLKRYTGFYLIPGLLAITATGGCEREDDLVAITSITTVSPVLSSSGIESGGTLVANREIELSQFGVVYSTSEGPTIEDSISPGINNEEYQEQGSYILEFTSLIPPQAAGTYYIRAFVTAATGTAYGDQMSITVN